MDRAKKNIANHHGLNEWKLDGAPVPISVAVDSVAVGTSTFQDNTERFPISNFVECHGDTLPEIPTVITGGCKDWNAFSSPGATWSVDDLAERTNDNLSLDGGPGFARMSICRGTVPLKEYQRYCNAEADGDSTPLYIFDPDILKATFVDGTLVADDYQIPPCFRCDAMECLTGTRFRPLPPAWLLVGVKRSGTPIHDHPMTVAWNALLVGCKLWCCLPPGIDERFLLLNLDGDGAIKEDFDKSAIDWFQKIGQLPSGAKIIVQRPGEIVFLPAGWFHVVLNVETSTAISVSLTLRRDIRKAFHFLVSTAEDVEMAKGWLKSLESNVDRTTKAVGITLEDLSQLRTLVYDACKNSGTNI